MKTIKNLHLVLIFFVLVTYFSCSKKDDNEPADFDKEVFYYYDDSLIYLDINSKMIMVAFNESGYTETLALSIYKNYPEIDLEKSAVGSNYRNHLFLKDGITEYEYLELLKYLNAFDQIIYATPSFFTDNGVGFLTNKFFIEPTMSKNEFENFLNNNLTKVSKVKDFYPGNLFIVNKIENGFEGVDFANKINVMDGIEYSCPSFSYLLDQMGDY